MVGRRKCSWRIEPAFYKLENLQIPRFYPFIQVITYGLSGWNPCRRFS